MKDSSKFTDNWIMRGIIDTVKGQDQFGDVFRMRIDKSNKETTSIVGGICSVLLTLMIITYGYLKSDVLINKKDVDILSTVNEYFFSEEEVFNHENGFAFAVALTGYDGNSDSILEPEYGELQFNHFKWGPLPDGNYESERKRIPSHQCTAEEIGLEGDKQKSLFQPTVKNSLGEVKVYQKKFQCVDKEYYSLYGDFNSYKA